METYISVLQEDCRVHHSNMTEHFSPAAYSSHHGGFTTVQGSGLTEPGGTEQSLEPDKEYSSRGEPSSKLDWPCSASSDEDSDLEHDLEAACLLMDGEACSTGVLASKSDSPRDNYRCPNHLETPRFDLVSPYKRMRLEDLTQSSVDSSQAAGEGEAHSLLRSRDDDAEDNSNDDAEDNSNDGADFHVGHGQKDDGACPSREAEYRDKSYPDEFDGDRRFLTEMAHTPNTIASHTSIVNTIPRAPSAPMESKGGRKKKPSFFNSLLEMAKFSKKTATHLRDDSDKSTNVLRNIDGKPKTPLRDVRNLAWAQPHSLEFRKETPVLRDGSPVSKGTRARTLTNLLSPQEMRASIPYIDEVCMDEDPFVSADEREFPPPPALNRTPLKPKPWRDLRSVPLESYRPDYQTLERRQISLALSNEFHGNEKDYGNNVANSYANLYDKIAGDEDDDVEDVDYPLTLRPECNTGSDPVHKTTLLSSLTSKANGISTHAVTANNNNETNSNEKNKSNDKSVGMNCSQDVPGTPNKSARSVGTSCANIPAKLHSSSLGALGHPAAPSESSVITGHTVRTDNTGDISGVYDTVDSLSESEAEQNIQEAASNSKIESNNDKLSSASLNINDNECAANSNSGNSGAGSGQSAGASVSKETISAGVSTDGLWVGQEVQTGSRYMSHQELCGQSSSLESAMEQKSSSLGNLHHSSSQILGAQQYPPHHHQQQQKQQEEHIKQPPIPDHRRSAETYWVNTHNSAPHHSSMPFHHHHHLDVVLEQSPAREDQVAQEDGEDLPPGASAKDFSKPHASPDSTPSCGTKPKDATEKMTRVRTRSGSQENLHPTLSDFSDYQPRHGTKQFPYHAERFPSEDDLQQISDYPRHSTKQFPHHAERFPSEDDLQQYLHRVEVENFLHHRQQLAQLQHDVGKPVACSGSSGSAACQMPEDAEFHFHPSASLVSHRSSQGSQKQLSSGSLRLKSSTGSVKHHSSGSLQHQLSLTRSDHSQGKVSQRSSGSVHHQSRSSQGSQGSTDRSNPSALATRNSSTKRAVLQSSGHLKLAVYWNVGLLTVHVIQARCLSSAWKTDCDSYVKMSLVPDDSRRTRCKTGLVKASNSPVFDEKFSLEILEEDRKKRLLISMWHKDSDTG